MNRESILIVDDTPANLKLVRIILQSEGYELRTAVDAEDALEQLKFFTPRLILLDIQLPGMDGLELTRRLRDEPKTRDVIIVALTAYAMKGDEQQALEAGCDGYIVKPIDTRALPLTVRRYLDGQKRPETSVQPVARAASTTGRLDVLRTQFLEDGRRQSRRLLDGFTSDFESGSAQKNLHNWAGLGSMFGHPEITRLAREAETMLRTGDAAGSARFMETLDRLAKAFAEAGPQAHL